VLRRARDVIRITNLDRLLPRWTQRRTLDSWIARVPPQEYQYPHPTLRRVRREGFDYELDLSDYMEWLIYYGILTEPRHALYALAPRGGCVLDVGSNVGEVAMHFARQVTSTGEVHAFEPMPNVFAKLQRHVSANRLDNVHLYNHGLGDAESVVTFDSPAPGNRGASRVDVGGEGLKLRVRRLDDVVAERGLTRVDVVKIDVEGYEVHVLRGARETLTRFRPTLAVECDDQHLRRCGESASSLSVVLRDLGYSLHDPATMKPLREEALSEGHLDLVALPA
jgi:FkbM family methyltransferase